jgi:transcription initiation factor TFIIIB Brf1 subunit/transcription initiation factor TFIIB
MYSMNIMVPWQGSTTSTLTKASSKRQRVLAVPVSIPITTMMASGMIEGRPDRILSSTTSSSFSFSRRRFHSKLNLNGPDSPPVTGSSGGDFPVAVATTSRSATFYNDANNDNSNFDNTEERCRNCHSTSIRTDWQQGDRVCTSCGVVAEGRILDDHPEWKDFNDAEDIVKGLPSKSRSGLVPVDETRYIGGLQPTILSKTAFGANLGGYKLVKIRKQLKSTNSRLDHLMQKAHQKALQDALLERKLRLRQQKRQTNSVLFDDSNSSSISSSSHHHHPLDDEDENDQSIRPEFDQMILQEEEEAHRMQAALYAEKWSLDRALVLYGTSDDDVSSQQRLGEDKEALLVRMDSTLKKASHDLYTAYSMLIVAARKLHLPERVMNEVVHQLVRYATRKDGFTVKGVSTRLSNKIGTDCKHTLKAATDRLVDYNKTKQMSSLGAAILFLTARNLGWTRTVVEICECFQPPIEISNNNEKTFLKPKHCSKAMAEIKALFPEYVRPPSGKNNLDESSYQTESNDIVSTSNFAEHFIRRLKLPPVAEATVRVLLVHCRQEQVELGHNSGTKISTLCAAITYFVCTLGCVMQRVAQQASLTKNSNSTDTSGQSSTDSTGPAYSRKPRKRLRLDVRSMPGATRSVTMMQAEMQDELSLEVCTTKLGPISEEQDHTPATVVAVTAAGTAEEEPFDVFTHPPVVEDQSDTTAEYEMRRMWDAWAEQMSWSRSLVEVEQSCGISKTVIVNLYKSDLYPRRDILLNVLKESVTPTAPAPVSDEGSYRNRYSLLQDTPQATILMAHIGIAAPLMNDK